MAVFNEGQRLRSAVLYGAPVREETVQCVTVAHFADDALVLYQLVTRRTQTFLLHGHGGSTVPGISPAVNLLAHGQNATESRKLARSVAWLAAHGYVPESLSDTLWLRISALLNRKGYGLRDLRLLVV